MEKETNQINDIVDSSQLDKEDILIIKVIISIILTIIVGIAFFNTGSFLCLLAYVPTFPYIVLPHDFWK